MQRNLIHYSPFPMTSEDKAFNGIDPKISPDELERQNRRALTTFQKQAAEITVENEADKLRAEKLLLDLKTQMDAIEEFRVFFTKPLNDQIKKINSLFQPQIKALLTMITGVKSVRGAYVLKLEQAARKEEERLAKIRAAADAKRAAEGKEAIPEPIKSVERAESTSRTEEGRNTDRIVWKGEVTDGNLVPREYCVPSAALIKNAIDQGVRQIPGVRIFEEVETRTTARR